MQKDFTIPKPILLTILSGFLISYPNLYIFTVSPTLSWGLSRLILLLVIAILGILVIKKSKITGFILYFVLTNIALSIIQVFNPSEDELLYTIIGTDDRLDGIVYQLALMIFIFFAFYALKNINFKKFFIILLPFSGSISVLTIIHQYTGVPIDVFGNKFSLLLSEITGLSGRSGYTAGFLITTVVFSVFLSLEKSKIYSFLGYFLLLINCIGLSLLQNRASIISVSIGLFFWLFLRKFDFRFLFTIALSIFLLNTVDRILLAGQTVNRDTADTTTLNTRLEIWKIALEIIPNSWGFPFWGGGTGAFKLQLSDKMPIEKLMIFYQKEYNWPSNKNIVKYSLIADGKGAKRLKTYLMIYKDKSQKIAGITLDRAHNFFLDKVLSIGLIGAIFWMIFYIYPIYAYFRLLKEKRDFFLQTLVITLFVVQIYYLFWFSVMQVEPIHVVIGLMTWIYIDQLKSKPTLTSSTIPTSTVLPAS